MSPTIRLKRLRRAGLAFFVAALALVTFWYFRANPLIRAANRMVAAMRDGDGDALYDATIAEEQSCSDLSPQKIHKVWEILIEPLVASSRLVGTDPTELDSNHTQVVAAFRYVTRQGDPWKLNVIANQSDGDAKTDVIYSMLSTASLFDADGHANPTLTPDLSLNGLRRYRARLEAVGIHRLMLGPGTCVTWDELQAKLQPRS